MTTQETGIAPGPCAKTRVAAVLILADGSEFVGTNYCRNPQPVCPRAPGEGYEKCRSVCQQPAHAEVDAIMNALRSGIEVGHLDGAEIFVQGHTHACESCQTFARSFGVTIHISPPPIRAPGFTYQQVAQAARFARQARFRRLGLDRSYDDTVPPSESELQDAACVLEWVTTERRGRFPFVGGIVGTVVTSPGIRLGDDGQVTALIQATNPRIGDTPIADFIPAMPVRRQPGRLTGLFPAVGAEGGMEDTGEGRAE